MAEGALADDAGALLQLLRAVVLEQVVVPPVAGEAAADFRVGVLAADFRVGVLARRTVGLVLVPRRWGRWQRPARAAPHAGAPRGILWRDANPTVEACIREP